MDTRLARINYAPSLSKSSSSSSVRSNSWTRQLTKDSRVYYYNADTGSSQWHIPNELYTSQLPDRRSRANRQVGIGLQRTSTLSDIGRTLSQNGSESLLMPGHAKALRRVDCLTEKWIPAEPEEVQKKKVQTLEAKKEATKKTLIEKECLRVFVKGAKGLRDADSVGDPDNVSDPFCHCTLSGACSEFRTPMVNDCLDPVWNHEGTIYDAMFGQTLIFTVWDDDATDALLKDHEFNQTFDNLGNASLEVSTALATEGPIELQLEETGTSPTGELISASLTVEVSGPCAAFPDLVDMDKDAAVALLLQARPDLSARLFEAPHSDSTCSVVSWDPLLSANGYKKNFFGAFQADAAAFEDGDKVEIFPKLQATGGRIVGDKKKSKVYAVEKIVPCGRSFKGQEIVYIHVQSEKFGRSICDGMQWRRMPKVPLPGYRPNRVCLYFEKETGKVIQCPRTG